MESITDDLVFEIISHLDVVSIAYLSITSKRFWKFSKTKRVQDRISQYQKFFVYKQWNKGLLEAVKNSNFNQIVFFIEKGADDINAAFLEALEQGNRTLVRYFEQLGISAIGWQCAFWSACEGGYQEFVDYVLEKYPESDLEQGMEAAAIGGHLKLIQYLISIKRPEDDSPVWYYMMSQAADRKHQDIIEFCIQQGCNRWDYGLEGAIIGGNMDLAEFFWNRGHQMPPTPLKRAAANGHKKMIDWLISKGEHDWDEGLLGAADAGRKDLVDFFIEKGARDWSQCVWFSARKGHLDLMKFFAQQDASQGFLELGFTDACAKDHREVILELIGMGVKRWNEGLIQAAQYGHKSLVEFLLEKGATDLSGALKAAESQGYPSIVKLLEQRIAQNPRVEPNLVDF